MTKEFFNRDLSWIDFNERVLKEALRSDLPLLERLNFLCITASNLDNFFMVRIAALEEIDVLKTAAKKIRSIIESQYSCLTNDLLPRLAKEGLEYVTNGAWTSAEQEYLQDFLLDEIFSQLTPLRFSELPLGPTGNSLYAAFLLELDSQCLSNENKTGSNNSGDDTICIVQIPNILKRVIILPETGQAKTRWTLLDDLVLFFANHLFPGYTATEKMFFKINHDADFSVDEERDEDFVEAMEEVLFHRETSRAVRMVYSQGSERLKNKLALAVHLSPDDLYESGWPLDLSGLLELTEINAFNHLKVKRHIYPHPEFDDSFNTNKSIWDNIKEHDICIHLPYQSFDPVVRFLSDAATDTNVIAIKATLYRTSGDSPIVRALEQAALNGKQVTAIIELKARFDEERNIVWAKNLEKAGVIVIYGLARLKVHAKISLVVRRENSRIRRYVHLSTGNYNDKTAKLYSDISLLTANEDFAYDAGLFFNMITGYSAPIRGRQLVTAPFNLKNKLLEFIERETKKSTQEHPGRILAKINALSDPDVIAALYRASCAGVKIFLNVRGICCLTPGVTGLSENIRVISIVDHFLEHSRIIYFENGRAEELYLSSADWMPRNLERRVELLFPVLNETIKKQLKDVLLAFFKDNCQAYFLESGGSWQRVKPVSGEKKFRVQEYFLKYAEAASLESKTEKKEFIVRRS